MEAVYFEQPHQTKTDMSTMEHEFIKKYETLPLLWSREHPDYCNKFKRNAAYDKLVPILRKFVPAATRYHVRRKINILRSMYRKELKKYLSSKSITSDGSIDCPYKRPSWKFQAMKFLLNENGISDFDNSQSESEVVIEETVDYDVDTLNDLEDPELVFIQEAEVESINEDVSESTVSPLPAKPFKRKKRDNEGSQENDSDTEVTMQRIFNHKGPIVVRNSKKRPMGKEHLILDRECTAVGSNVTCKLQRMEVDQRHYAEQLVNKILMRGLRGTLSEETDFNDVDAKIRILD